MAEWMKGFYIGEGVKNPRRTKQRIDSGKITPGIYLVTLSDNPNHLMEIIPALMLLQKPFQSLCPPVIGMASDKDEAMELVRRITEEVYQATGAFQIEEYWKNR